MSYHKYLVDVTKLFWRKSRFPQNLEMEKIVLMSEPALKCENNASFNQIYTLKLFIAFKMAYSCCFSLGGNLDIPEFLQKKFYNINYRQTLRTFVAAVWW